MIVSRIVDVRVYWNTFHVTGAVIPTELRLAACLLYWPEAGNARR